MYKTKFFTIISFSLLLISCNRSSDKQAKEIKKEIKKEFVEVYSMPDYSKLGYKELEFTGYGSQMDMNNVVGENLRRAEKRLKEIIDSIYILYNKEDVFYSDKQKNIFFKTFEISHQTWNNYFNTMIELKFPRDNEFAGSSTGMSIAEYKKDLIDNRIRDLNPWLIGYPQGDVSGGTIRTID